MIRWHNNLNKWANTCLEYVCLAVCPTRINLFRKALRHVLRHLLILSLQALEEFSNNGHVLMASMGQKLTLFHTPK